MKNKSIPAKWYRIAAAILVVFSLLIILLFNQIIFQVIIICVALVNIMLAQADAIEKGEDTNLRILKVKDVDIAVIRLNELIIKDVLTAIDIMISIKDFHNINRVVIKKKAVTEDFFDMSTGLAREILHQLSIRQKRLAILGDFSVYKNDAFDDFVNECNQGDTIFFAEDEESAIDWLAGLK